MKPNYEVCKRCKQFYFHVKMEFLPDGSIDRAKYNGPVGPDMMMNRNDIYTCNAGNWGMEPPTVFEVIEGKLTLNPSFKIPIESTVINIREACPYILEHVLTLKEPEKL